MEWAEILLGGEPLDYLLQVGIRTVLMFVLILLTLRILGKKGVKQLSVFELVVILGLGTAAGDPVIKRDAGC